MGSLHAQTERSKEEEEKRGNGNGNGKEEKRTAAQKTLAAPRALNAI
jgi:hypothetical protein